MPAVYDGTYTASGPTIDAATVGDAGLWKSYPDGHWTVTGSVLTGSPTGSLPSYLVRPSGEPYPTGTSGRAGGVLRPYGPDQAVIGVTPSGGWGSSAVAWGLALCWSMPGSDPADSSYYLLEARPGTATDRPSTLTISKVEAGTSTALGSVAWTNDPTRDYDLVFSSSCECLGKPVYLFATVTARSTPPPNWRTDSTHDLAVGPAGVTSLVVTDAAPGLGNGLVGVPALVSLPGTAGAPFVRVRLYGDSVRSLYGFGPRMIGEGWYIASDGTITANPATANYAGGMVLPL